MKLTCALLLLAWAATAPLHADAVIEAAGELPADTLDQRGDTIGGIGSGLVYDAANGTYLCVSDRGPGDGTLPYSPRYVTLRITQKGGVLTPRLVGSQPFRDQAGREMTGLIPDDTSASIPRMKDGRTCIDPEAIAIAPDGTLYVTDEYGPYLYQFRRDGRMIRRIEMPEDLQPRDKRGRLNFRNDAKLASGRNINQGPEGMCLLPGGRTAALIFQSGLVQQGGKKSPTTNLLLIDLATGALQARYLYPFATSHPVTGRPLKSQDLSANDIVALSATRFLVLERDGFGRDGAQKHPPASYKAVWVADLAGQGLSVKKQLLFDLPSIVSDPGNLAAKWEGIALIPPRRRGEVTLMMSADNDFLSPVIHESGRTYTFPRAKDAVPSQFFKIRASLPEKP